MIIWIHGGWLKLGDPMFDDRMHLYELISKDGYGLDIVVGAPGYRLNIFGFWAQKQMVSYQETGDSGINVVPLNGFLKMLKYFRGNNSSVTLGGVSAGISPLEDN